MATSKPSPEEKFLLARGLDPAEWYVPELRLSVRKGARGDESTTLSGKALRRPASLMSKATLADLKRLANRRPSGNAARRGDVLLEIPIHDAHLGSWSGPSKETFVDAHCALISRALDAGPVGKILIAPNGDLMHVDSVRGETTKGTRLEDVKAPYQEVFRESLAALMGVINFARTQAPVDVLVSPGNHDFHASFAIGEALRMAYADVKGTTIDNSTEKYRYYRWGSVLLGFTHGDTGNLKKLPALMASDRPDDFAATTWREWHTGHVHNPTLFEAGGVRVRTAPPIQARSAWSRNRGYEAAMSCAEAYLWDRHRSFLAQLNERLHG